MYRRNLVNVARQLFFSIGLVICSDTLLALQFGGQPDLADQTPVEYVNQEPGPQTALGTKKYQPSKLEKPFFEKLAPDEITTGGLAGDYNIQIRDKKFIGWFGIVREITVDQKAGTTRLLIEHKYFDGLTDLHLQAVSFNGSGDFQAVLNGTDHFIEELELVKIYGVVAASDNEKLPSVDTKYVRCWSWGTFTFITAAGKQRGSEKWRKLNTVSLEDIYSSRPDEQYYFNRLGPTKELGRRTQLEMFGRQAAVAMRLDPNLLRAPSGSCTKLIGTEEFRKRALAAAMKLQHESNKFIEPIVDAIAEQDYERMHAAIDAALEAGQHDAVAAALTWAYVLDDEDDTAATNALGNLSFSAGKCLPALIEALRCDDAWSRSHAAEILGNVGEPAEGAIPALIIAAADSDDFVRANAVEALGRIHLQPEFVVPAMTLALGDIDSHVRFTAAGTLEVFGPEARSSAPALAELVKHDPEETVSWSAADALGQTGNAEVALPVLVESLSSESSRIRRFSARGLGSLGRKAKEAVPQLKKLLADRDPGVQVATAEALWKIDGNTKDSLPVLSQVLRGGGFPAIWAANALIDFGPAAKPVLNDLMATTSQDNRYAQSSAIRVVFSIGAEAKSTEPRLIELLNDDDGELRVFAAAALWKIAANEDALKLVLSELETNENDRYEVIRAIGMIGKPARAALPTLRKSITDQDPFVRQAARETIQVLEAE